MDKFPPLLQALLWFLFLFGLAALAILGLDSLR